ncbi:hypothetical protein V8C37DRAFT_381866 [Trichoderma ceciliae]
MHTGLCHTDIVIHQGGVLIGRYPVIFGHGIVGVVRKTGSSVSNRPLAACDIIILSLYTCSECRFFQEGNLGGCVHMAGQLHQKCRGGPELAGFPRDRRLVYS